MRPGRKSCASLTLAGLPCRSWAVNDEDVCLAHSQTPAHVETIRAARLKGGKHVKWNAEQAAVLLLGDGAHLETASDVRKQLCRIYSLVKSGDLSPSVAGSLGFILSGILKTITTEFDMRGSVPEETVIELVWPAPDPLLLPEPGTGTDPE